MVALALAHTACFAMEGHAPRFLCSELPTLSRCLFFLQLEKENEKLRYQVMHLKRAVRAGDEKIVALTAAAKD